MASGYKWAWQRVGVGGAPRGGCRGFRVQVCTPYLIPFSRRFACFACDVFASWFRRQIPSFRPPQAPIAEEGVAILTGRERQGARGEAVPHVVASQAVMARRPQSTRRPQDGQPLLRAGGHLERLAGPPRRGATRGRILPKVLEALASLGPGSSGGGVTQCVPPRVGQLQRGGVGRLLADCGATWGHPPSAGPRRSPAARGGAGLRGVHRGAGTPRPQHFRPQWVIE